MDKIDVEHLQTFKKETSEKYEELTKKVNEKAVETYNTIFGITEKFSKVTDKLSVISDMFTDLRVLNGTAKNIRYLSELDVVEKQGVDVEDDIIKLSSFNKKLREYDSNLSSISSIEPYRVRDIHNKGTSLDTLLKTNSEISLVFDNDRYTFTLNLIYPKIEQINNIELVLGLLTKSYPIINSIKYLDTSNHIKEVLILNNNSRNMDLDEDRVKGNLYDIKIESVETKQLMIEFTSRISSEVTLERIQTFFSKNVLEGFVVFGPIQVKDPLMKIAIDASKSTSGVTYEISTDKAYWLPLTPSSQMSITGNKIITFNTINSKSIKTTQDIFSFYVKVTLKSSNLSSENVVSLLNTYREDNSMSNSSLTTVEEEKLSLYRNKSSDFIYGKYKYTNNLNTLAMSLKEIEYFENNGMIKVLGLVESKYSVTQTNTSSNTTGSFGVELKLKKQPSSNVIDARNFDLCNSRVYDIYLKEVNGIINVNHKENLVLNLKEKEDFYTITSKLTKKTVELDLNTPFSKNSVNMIIQVPNEDIVITNSLNEVVRLIKREELLSLKEVEYGIEIVSYFINLVDVLFDKPSVSSLSYNKLYPLVALEEGEFGLKDGKIVVKSNPVVSYKGFEMLITEVEVGRFVSYTNGNYMKRVEEGFTYYEEQFEDNYNLKTTVKLKSSSIAKGSLVIEEFYGDINDYSSTPKNREKLLNINTREQPILLGVDEEDDLKVIKE